MKFNVAVIILYDRSRRYLLQHRSSDARMLPDIWAFFGGSINKNESPEAAVKREAYEELRYRLKSPRCVHDYAFRQGPATGRIYVFIERFTAAKKSLELHEGQGMGWFSQKEMADLKMLRRDRGVIAFLEKYLTDKGHDNGKGTRKVE